MKAVAVCSRAGIWEGQVREWRLDLPGRARGRRDGGWSCAAGAGRGLGKQRRSGTAKIQSHLPGGQRANTGTGEALEPGAQNGERLRFLLTPPSPLLLLFLPPVCFLVCSRALLTACY